MSGIQEELLGPRVTTKRIFALILISVLLISCFAYSVVAFSWLFGSPRLTPDQYVDKATPTDDIVFLDPPFPFSLEDLLDFFKSLNLTDDDIEDFMDDLEDYIDGDIDDLDLGDLGSLLPLLFLANITVFTVSDYDDYDSIFNNLWKYECFETYNGDGWESSFDLGPHNYIPQSDYDFYYSSQDNLTISMPLSPEQTGPRSFMIPNLFPDPFIIENSVYADNINPASALLRKNELNSTTLLVEFTDVVDDDLTYEMFGSNITTLTEIESEALHPSLTPTDIANTYLQLPPTTIANYISSNDDFRYDYDDLDVIIEDTDKATVVAQKTKDFLNANFNFNLNASETYPKYENEDHVNWFCRNHEGIWSDFASAFVVFTRAFGLSSRYVSGFHTRLTPPNETEVQIRYRDMYSWAEVYIPTSYGGEWIQVDVCNDIFPDEGISPFNLTLTTNFTSGYRDEGEWANLTATLTHPNVTISNRPISFYDEYMDMPLGTVLTDQNGIASYFVEIDNSQTIGPHIISASYSLFTQNITRYTIFDYDTANDINLELNSLSKSVVDLDGPDPTVIVDGFLEDPLNGNPVYHGVVNFTLIQKVGGAPQNPGISFPLSTNTGDTGNFSEVLWIDYSVPSGEYQIQADFSGIWLYDFYGNPYPDYEPLINDTLVRLDLNITKKHDYSVWFYMDDFAANDIYNPEVERSSTIELKAIIKDEGIPLENVSVGFYDSNDVLKGSGTTDPSGTAIYYYTIDDSIPAGPNRIYARFSNVVNNSYFILNAPIHFDFLNNFPNPSLISRVVGSDAYIFRIFGGLYDVFSNPIKYGDFEVKLYDGVTDVSLYLIGPETGETRTDEFGEFDVQFRVADTTPLKNYTVTLNFSKSFTYPTPEPFFNFPAHLNFTASKASTHTLDVWDPDFIEIFFYVEGNPALSVYDDANLPERYNQGEIITLDFLILQSTIGVTEYTARIYDVDRNNELVGTYTYNSTEWPQGYANATIDTAGWSAGLHQLRINWNDLGTFNSTYIIINKTATIDANPNKLSITRGPGSGGFSVSGDVTDNSFNLRGLNISIYLFNSLGLDRTSYLNFNLDTEQYMIIDPDGTFQFNIDSVAQTLIQGAYTIRIDFNGTISNSYLGSQIFLSDYMVHFSSDTIDINITASTQIVEQDYYTLIWETIYPTKWVVTDTLIVTGRLTWDNNTAISNMRINVTIENIGGIMIAFNDTVFTDLSGLFNISIYVDPSNPLWPTYRSDSRIWVEFDPILNGLDYVDLNKVQYL